MSDVDDRLERSLGTRWAGRLGGPAAAVVIYLVLPSGPGGLDHRGRATVAVGVLMAVLWMTEAMPLPATSLLPVALFPLFGVVPIDEATAPYANRVIFLFIGGLMLARAMQRWELHRRIALVTVVAVGTSPTRLVGGFMAAAAIMSMWVSNTAATVMMLPIATSIVLTMESRWGAEPSARFAPVLMLGVAYAASIGSVGTPIGTPPNLLLKGFVKSNYDIDIGFGQWMALGLPLVAVFLPLAWLVLIRPIRGLGMDTLPEGRDLIRRELVALGRVSRGEWTVMAVFSVTAAGWVLREPLSGWPWLVELLPAVGRLDDAMIAVAAAVALFVLPISARRGVFALDWDTAREIPWGILLLFGGGLSLANAIQTTGVDTWIGTQAGRLEVLPVLALVAVVATAVVLLTEVTSNTATAATLLPVLGGVALGLGLEPMMLLIPVALSATFAFMLPVATPPNAIVFGSGYVTIGQMVRAGAVLNVLAVLLVTAGVLTVGRLLFAF